MSYCSSGLAESSLTQWRGDYTPNTWSQLVPSKDPWNTAVNQQTGHQGSLDILKMCFRYLGKFVDTFFQCPYRAGTSHGRRDMSGTHGTALFGSPGQSTTSGLYPAVWLGGGGNWKHQDIGLCGLQAWKLGIRRAWKPVEWEQRGSVQNGSLLAPENHVAAKDLFFVPLFPAECLERKQAIVPLDSRALLSLGTFSGG